MIGVPGTSIMPAFLMAQGSTLMIIGHHIRGHMDFGNEVDICEFSFAHMHTETYITPFNDQVLVGCIVQLISAHIHHPL
jgi:hypothetical protein